MKTSVLLSILTAAACSMSALAQNEAKPAGPKPFKIEDQRKSIGDAKKAAEEARAKLDPNDPMVKYGTPGVNHKHMEPFVGEWDGEIKMWFAPGTEPQTSTTKAVIRLDMDGRYLRANYTGDVQGLPFRGQSVWGYNNLRNEYESTWIDNMSSGITFSTGKSDGAGKVFTFNGEADDPMASKKVKQREVTTLVDSDSWKMEVYRPGPDGKEFKSMQIDFKRSSGTLKRGGRAVPGAKAPIKDADKPATPAPAAPK